MVEHVRRSGLHVLEADRVSAAGGPVCRESAAVLQESAPNSAAPLSTTLPSIIRTGLSRPLEKLNVTGQTPSMPVNR